jgi:hypothetical protein
MGGITGGGGGPAGIDGGGSGGSMLLGPGRARGFQLNDTDDLSASHTIGAEDVFSMVAWIKTSDQTGIAKSIMGLFSSDLNDDGYLQLFLTTGGVPRVFIETDGGVGTGNTFGTTDVRDGAWHLVACAVDGSTLTIWVDDGTDTPAAHSRAMPTIDTISIGARVDPTPDQAFDGDIDEASFWEGTKITDAHVASLWSIGNDSGVRYLASFAGASVPTPTHHYSLSEAQNPGAVGTDEIGSLDLTDNGTTDVSGIPAGD